MTKRNPKTYAQQVAAFIGTSEAGALLGVCENTVRKWADEGRLPCVREKKNKRRRFPLSQIKKFAAALKAAP